MRTKRILCIGIILSISLLALASCYQAKYSLEKCSIENQGVEFTSRYEAETFTAYFDSSVKSKIADEWIDRFAEYSDLLNEKGIDNTVTYYVSNQLVADSANHATEGTVVYILENTAKDEAFAWVLNEKLRNGELPYGVYAGLAAYWFNNNEYKLLSKSEITNAGYLAEMQFPIYEADNLSSAERATAWNISYTLISDWINSGKTERDLVRLSEEEFEKFLYESYQITLPEYKFYKGNKEYEYKVFQGCFTYYINKEFNDLLLPKSHFSTSYKHLSDWLKDNWAMKLKSDEALEIDEMYDITVYLNDGRLSTGHTGVANALNRTIIIYSAESFSHEYIHHILFQKGMSGNLIEFIPQMHASESKYEIMGYYFLIATNSQYPYFKGDFNGIYIDEKKEYKETMRLYNKKSHVPASEDNFDYWLFADCYAALYTQKDTPFISRAQSHSFFRYVANAYGNEYILKLNESLDVLIEGKTLDEITDEWIQDYLPSILE